MLFYIFLRLAIAKKVDKCSIFALTREDKLRSPLYNIEVNFVFSARLLLSLRLHAKIDCARFVKYRNKLRIFRSLVTIFAPLLRRWHRYH